LETFLLQKRRQCRKCSFKPVAAGGFEMGRNALEFALWRDLDEEPRFSTQSTRRTMGCKPAARPGLD
jgi:hypothetical protein